VGRDESIAAIERFSCACVEHPLVVAAFLGGSYAAGRAREDSDIDLYLITEPFHYAAFLEDRHPRATYSDSAAVPSWLVSLCRQPDPGGAVGAVVSSR